MRSQMQHQHRLVWAGLIAAGLLLGLYGMLSAAVPGHAPGALDRQPGTDTRAQWLVRLANGPGNQTQDQLSEAGLRLVRSIPQLGMLLVEADSGPLSSSRTDDNSTAGRLQAMVDAGIALYAEPNAPLELTGFPSDPLWVYQQPYLGAGRLELPTAWLSTTGRADIVIAVIDTGIFTGHPDLSTGIWTNMDEIAGNGIDDDHNGYVDDRNGWNFVNHTPNVDDPYGHGTSVAGIAAARIDNAIGMAGIAGGATLMPLRIFGPVGSSIYGTYAEMIEAIVYAVDNGARVINLSVGAHAYLRGGQAAVDYAWSRGAVVVAGSGNSGTDDYYYPAAYNHVIGVGATSAVTDTWTGASNYGPFVSLSAPGDRIVSTTPGGYAYFGGTSASTPHVSGLAALILSLDDTLTPDQVRAIMQETADDLGTAGYDPYYGFGRIDAAAALARVTPRAATTPPNWPPLALWPANCQALFGDGSFEAGNAGWGLAGSVAITTGRAYLGSHALAFAGGSGAQATITRAITLPFLPAAGAMAFAYRVETSDSGTGTTPEAAWNDELSAELQTASGQTLLSLFRVGNTDLSRTDPTLWDRYLHRLDAIDFAALAGARSFRLVFKARHGTDDAPTNFYLDDVRFCMAPGPLFLPLVQR